MIATECRDGISIVRLNRPAQHNAMVPALLEQLVRELKRLPQTQKPVVLSGTGNVFCAGADLRWLASLPDPALGVADLVAVHHLAISTIVEMKTPVIAAINGTVAGGGLGLALATDYTIAAEQASFTAAYFKLGLTPDGGSSAFLERAIGPVRTRELLLTNRRLSAREACAWGLINEVVADGEILDRAVQFANELLPVPAYTLVQTRRLLDASYLRNQLQLESVAIRTAAKSEFFRQAIAAFRDAHPD